MTRIRYCFFLLILMVAAGPVFAQTDQTITFDSIPTITLGDSPMLLAPTSSSGLDVTLTIIGGSNVTLSNDSIYFNDTGTVSIKASQAGDGSFNPAPDVIRTFCVSLPAPDIFYSVTLGEISLTSVFPKGNQWFFNGAPIGGATEQNYFVLQAGIYSVQTDSNGCVSPRSSDQTLEALSQTIVFDTIPDVSINQSPIILNAESTPGLTVQFASLTENVAMVDSAAFLLQPGRATIVASQAGNYIFNAAANVQRTFCVNPATPFVSDIEAPGGILLSSTSDVNNVWYLNGNIIPGASGNTLLATASGSYSVQVVTPDGCKSPFSNSDVTHTYDQTVIFGPLDDVTQFDPAITLSATSTSGLAVVFVAATSNVSISGNQASFPGSGTATINATQPGNGVINAAPAVPQSFCINPAKPVITATGTGAAGVILSSSNPTGNQWFLDGNAIEGGVNQTISASSTGSYTVQTTVDNCVGVVSDGHDIVATVVTGIGYNESQVTLYPNPANDFIRISLGSSGANSAVMVMDMMGRVVREPAVTGQTIEVNTAAFAPGVYLVRVNQGNRVQFARFIKN